MSLVTILLALLLVCLLLWAARALLAAFAIEDPIRTVIYVIIVVLIVLWLISGASTGGAVRLPRVGA